MAIMPAAMGTERCVTCGLERPVGTQSGSPGDLRQRVALLEHMVKRLTRKLERTDGESLATQDARLLVDFEAVSHEPVDIEEAGR